MGRIPETLAFIERADEDRLTPRLHEQEWQRKKQRELERMPSPSPSRYARSTSSSSSSSHGSVVGDEDQLDQLDRLFATM